MGRIKSLEDRLIDTARLERMLQAPNAVESLRVLTEAGYGAPATAQAPQDYERLIENELAETGKLIHEITPDEAVTDLFMMRYDYANAKALLQDAAIGKPGAGGAERLGPYPNGGAGGGCGRQRQRSGFPVIWLRPWTKPGSTWPGDGIRRALTQYWIAPI